MGLKWYTRIKAVKEKQKNKKGGIQKTAKWQM